MNKKNCLALLLALLSSFFACVAMAQPAGRMLVAVGDVVANRGGRDVALVTGAEVFRGDTVRVGEFSNAQIGFTDNAVVALRAKSAFSIDEYIFDRDAPAISKAAFSLLRGGVRTLTGLIGRTDRNSYRVRTPSATVGIRGTHYTLVICQRDCLNSDGSLATDGTYGGVLEGRVALTNQGGEREFGIDEYFFVADINTPPKPLVGRPGFLHDRLESRARRESRQSQAAQNRPDARPDRDDDERGPRGMALAKLDPRNDPANRGGNNDPRGMSLPSAVTLLGQNNNIAVTDLRDSSGNVAVLGPGLGLSIAYATALSARSTTDGGTGTAIIVGSDGALERFKLLNGEIVGARDTSSIVDAGRVAGDGNINWGRWTQGSTVTVDGSTFTPPTGVHFIVGALTPPDVLAKPAASIGVTASAYDYVGGTKPTDGSGQSGQFLGGVFTVDFLARTISGGVSYKLGNITFTLPVPAGTGLLARPGVVGFAISPRNGGSWTNNVTNAGGTLDTYAISGLFLGSRAQGLGVTFATIDLATGRTAGNAVFRCRNCKP